MCSRWLAGSWATAALFATPAAAADSARLSTLSAAYSRFFAGGEASSGDANTLSGSLSRRIGATTLSLGGGATQRDVQFPDAVEQTDAKAYAAGGAIAHAVNGADLALSIDYAKENSDLLIAVANAPPLPASGQTTFLSVSGAVSRSFGGETRLTPSVSGGWSRATAEFDATIVSRPFSVKETSTGWSGAAGLLGAHDIGARWTLSAGGAAVYAQEAGALAITRAGGRSGRPGGLFSGLQTIDKAGDVFFGEVAAGLSTRLGRVTIATDAARSIGLGDDYFILSSTASVDF